jgi:hypothetical protein
MPDPDDAAFDFQTMAERVNARLKDEFGARFVRVRGAIKLKCQCSAWWRSPSIKSSASRTSGRRPLEPRGTAAQRRGRKSSATKQFCKRINQNVSLTGAVHITATGNVRKPSRKLFVKGVVQT